MKSNHSLAPILALNRPLFLARKYMNGNKTILFVFEIIYTKCNHIVHIISSYHKSKTSKTVGGRFVKKLTKGDFSRTEI